MNQKPDSGIGEQALNKAVEIALSSQLEGAERLDIDIDCNPLELAKGEVNSVSMRGEDLVMPHNLSIKSILLETDHIAINLLKAASGKIEFSESTDASVQVVLTEANLNSALQTDYLRDWISNIPIWVGGQKLRIELQEGTFSLPGQNKVELTAKSLVHFDNQTQLIAFSVGLRFEAGGNRIIFEGGRYLDRKELPFSATVALLGKASEILDLRSLLISDLLLKIERIEVKAREMKLWLKANVDRIPSLPV